MSRKFSISDYLEELVYGGTDGIITTFAVVSGYIGAIASSSQSTDQAVVLTSSVVLFFGLANLFADATSMGLGDYLANKSNNGIVLKRRRKIKALISKKTSSNRNQTFLFLQKKGFSNEDAKSMAEIIVKYKEFWGEFIIKMQKNEEFDISYDSHISALATFLSFMFFGSIPLIPYLFSFPESFKGFLSVLFTGFALVLLGTLRWFFTKEKLYIPILETLLLGGIAAFFAYLVGVIIGV